jgi:hypothetical protein
MAVGMSMKSVSAEETVNGKDRQTGFLVVAAYRGFLGNEEIIDEFHLFAKGRNASLIFVTDERTQKYIDTSVDRLVQREVGHIVVIPLFISSADPRYRLAQRLLQNKKSPVPITYAPIYGSSVFAVETLADRFRTIRSPADTGLVVVGYGAVDNESEQGMLIDWKRISEKASAGFGFSSINVLIGHDKKNDTEERSVRLKQELVEVIKNTENKGKTVVVPFHLGPKFDSMMSFDARLKQLLPPDAELVSEDNLIIQLGSSKNAPRIATGLAAWLERQAYLSQPLAADDVGIVFLSHGSDFNWNETMRESVQSLTQRYKIEFAFSMADQVTVERAIRKLEQRGARAAIILRVFAMKESFRKPIERMAGLDIEGIAPNAADNHAGYTHGHGHGEGVDIPAPRIRTRLPIRTVGGLGSHPLFAAALLERARMLSRNPALDTVILVAHGSGSDNQNDRWHKALEEIAAYMQDIGGSKFHAIKVATWREDWTDKREPCIRKVRDMVEEAGKDGGRAIVIPARTTGHGLEKEFLSGLEYDLGSGFAPHPLFVQWVEEQIKTGLAQFTEARHAETIIAEW